MNGARFPAGPFPAGPSSVREEAAIPPDPSSTLAASFARCGEATRLHRVFETGALRLRLARGAALQGAIVNTGGGILGADRLKLDFTLAAGAAATLTTVAAEKVYRSAGATARVDTALKLAAGARLDWLPQETILFDGCRLRRSLAIDMAGDAQLFAAEMVVFGRLARGETAIGGLLHDSWRLRRDGCLVFADESRLEGAIGASLDRPAVGAGARAAALLLIAAPAVERLLDPLRDALAPFGAGDPAGVVEFGASARDGILVARLLARSPDRLRTCMVSALGAVRDLPLPRAWT